MAIFLGANQNQSEESFSSAQRVFRMEYVALSKKKCKYFRLTSYENILKHLKF